jgi:hypothetical protein
MGLDPLAGRKERRTYPQAVAASQLGHLSKACRRGINRLLKRPLGIGEVVERPHLTFGKDERQHVATSWPRQTLADLGCGAKSRRGLPYGAG